MIKEKIPPNAVVARVRNVDFSIGCLTSAKTPGEGYQVAIVLEPKEVNKPGHDAVLLDDWAEVMAVVQSLIDAATNVWGLPPGAISITSDDPPPTAH